MEDSELTEQLHHGTCRKLYSRTKGPSRKKLSTKANPVFMFWTRIVFARSDYH